MNKSSKQKKRVIAHVLILGGTTFDHVVTLDEFPKSVPQTIHKATFFETAGSTGTGKSVSLKRLGVSNTLYSVLGNDHYGKKIMDYLKSEEVDFIINIDNQGTERHINIMDSKGKRISMFITLSSEFPLVNKKILRENIKKCDIVVLNIISYCKEFIPLLRGHKKPVWTDLHDFNEGSLYHKPFIEVSDYIFLSSDNLKNYKKIMQEFIQMGKELVVCTHGEEGATAFTKDGEWIDEPALTGFQIIDTNGAGDNFFSGFLYAYLKEKSIKVCMRYGAICGALCISSQKIVSEKLTANLIEDMYTRYYGS